MKSPTIIEFHILQSFPATCLNRDDVNAPKSCLIGGVTRARVSSQCWKRQVRLDLREQGVSLGVRTKELTPLFEAACVAAGASASQAHACGAKIAEILADDTLLFIGHSEAEAFAAHASSLGFDAEKLKEKDLAQVSKKALLPGTDGLDIALFGRMVAKAPSMNVEAACAFSHAISTHQVVPEIDFFTAVDDSPAEAGAAHMGATEFNSATYYRYVSLDVTQLAKQMSDEDLRDAVTAFSIALFRAVPAARQSTYAGFGTWDFARVLVRSGQRVQASFEAPVKATGSGFLEPSIERLKQDLAERERVFGTLYGKRWSCDVGRGGQSIDALVEGLRAHLGA